MENNQINEILSDMISAYATPGIGRAAIAKVASKLATSCIEQSFDTAGGFEAAKAALSKCGTVLGESGGELVCGVTASGFGNANPCYMLIFAKDGKINVKAYAKEGLIKQHTAEKALQAFKNALAE